MKTWVKRRGDVTEILAGGKGVPLPVLRILVSRRPTRIPLHRGEGEALSKSRVRSPSMVRWLAIEVKN